ncbi:hypothetical protein OEZ86_012808 [Tetradesmus obliquus]|nr:hypothetical protein OEZ86_012808 [Tetradesmus obliquus]
MVGADHRRNQSPCEDVVAWRTPLGGRQQVGLFCVFDGHHSRQASQQAEQLLPQLLAQHLPQQQQQLCGSSTCSSTGAAEQQQQQQQQQQQRALLADEACVAAALTASFLETDRQLACDDGCTATALLLEGCADGCVLLRVANVGDSMALLVDLSSAGWRVLTEDHRIAGNPAEAARLSAKNSLPGGVSSRLYGLNIARMLGDRFLKEADVGFTAEPYAYRFTDRDQSHLFQAIQLYVTMYSSSPEPDSPALNLVEDALKMPFTVFTTGQKKSMLKWLDRLNGLEAAAAAAAGGEAAAGTEQQQQYSVLDVTSDVAEVMNDEGETQQVQLAVCDTELVEALRRAFQAEQEVLVQLGMRHGKAAITKMTVQ